MGGCGLSSTDVNFLQEIEVLKETNAESKEVKILELRRQVANSKSVIREKHESVRMGDSVCHEWEVVVSTGSGK